MCKSPIFLDSTSEILNLNILTSCHILLEFSDFVIEHVTGVVLFLVVDSDTGLWLLTLMLTIEDALCFRGDTHGLVRLRNGADSNTITLELCEKCELYFIGVCTEYRPMKLLK